MLSDEIKNDLEKLKLENYEQLNIIDFNRFKNFTVALFIKNKEFYVTVGVIKGELIELKFIKREICLKFEYDNFKNALKIYNEIYDYLKEEK